MIKQLFNRKYLRHWLVLSGLLLALAVSLAPKPKYRSPRIISGLDIPFTAANWQGKDVSSEIDIQDERFNFVSDVLARVYRNDYYEDLLFIILDAGNFHHPKVCFGASGFEVRELNNVILPVAGRELTAKGVYVQKGNDSYVILFWMCVDKKIVDWTEQKLKQLFFSMFNRQKIGLMVRLDIPVKGEQIDYAISRATDFLIKISASIPPEQQDYLFGAPAR